MKKEIIRVLEENEFWRVSIVEKKSKHLVVSFASTPRIDEEVATEQFIGTATGYGTTIFVIDKKSSYGNGIDMDRIADLIMPYAKDKSISLVGFCMGGFLAVAFSKILNANSVVSITPQWSIHSDYLDSESYLNKYRVNVNNWKIKSLESSFSETCNYYIFASDDDDDKAQIKYFPKDIKNLKIFDFGYKFRHDLPKELGIDLSKLILYCFKGLPEKVDSFITNYYVNS